MHSLHSLNTILILSILLSIYLYTHYLYHFNLFYPQYKKHIFNKPYLFMFHALFHIDTVNKLFRRGNVVSSRYSLQGWCLLRNGLFGGVISRQRSYSQAEAVPLFYCLVCPCVVTICSTNFPQSNGWRSNNQVVRHCHSIESGFQIISDF